MRYIELAFVVVCVVAVLQALGRRLPVPMAALQIGAGVALSAVASLDDLHEQSALLFVLLVPPLLYLEAWQVPKRELLRSIRPVLGLAVGLVGLTILVLGFGLHALLPQMPLAVAFALAAALASTDTVAVGSVAARMPLPARLQVLLSGESLFNDAVALVAFKVAVLAAVTAHFSASQAALSLLTISAGGLLIGLGVALVAYALRRALISGTADGVRVDTTLSLLIPYAAYLAADKLDASGVLSVVAAGMATGVLDRHHLRATTRLNGGALWSTLTLSLNGAVFVMLGLEMPQVLQRVQGHSRWSLLAYVAALTLALLALRLAWTLLLAAWMRRQRPHEHAALPSLGMWLVAVLCGVRGSLALSATLSIPLLTAAGQAMPGRDLAVFLAASTIAATLLVSALVLPWVRPGPVPEDGSLLSAPGARMAMARTALDLIEADPAALARAPAHDGAMALARQYRSRLAALASEDQAACAIHRRDLAAQQQLSRRILLAQRHELMRLQASGALRHAVLQDIEFELDLAEIALDRLA